MTGNHANAAAWLIWFAGIIAIPLVSRNPLYLGVSLMAVVMVHLASGANANPSAGAWRLFAYIGSSVSALAILFNLLTVHSGDQVIGSLPAWLPIIGGTLTFNALIYGVSSAMAISTVLFGAATFNMNVRHGDLVRLMPSGLSRLGVAGGIALAFVPQLVTAGRDIYDVQRSRGFRFRGIRDAPVLLVPLLSTSMERAITLSEALETRGFGVSASSRPSMTRRNVALAGIVMSAGVSLWCIAVGNMVGGLAALLFALVPLLLVTKGPQTSRTRLRPMIWNLPSAGVALSAAGPIFVVLLHLFGFTTIAFEPFPRLEFPEFEPLLGLMAGSPVVAAYFLGRTP